VTHCRLWAELLEIAQWLHITMDCRHTAQHLVCHERQFKVVTFRHTQPLQYREGVTHMVVATKSEYQTSCGVEYGLRTSLKISRKPSKEEVAIIEPGVDQQDHKTAKAVVGHLTT